MSKGKQSDANRYFVTIRSWGRLESPGEADYEQFDIEAESRQEAKTKAHQEAESSGHIGRSDASEIVEVDQYE